MSRGLPEVPHRGPAVNARAPWAETTPASPTRLCIVYQCRHPVTYGGAERWLGSLARALTREGSRVTYVHGAGRDEEDEGGVHWVGVSDGAELYSRSGVRRVLPAVRFAGAAARYLRSNRGAFDLVYVHDMPLLPVLGARWGLRGSSTPWVVEWIEWWSASYWRDYSGALLGTMGYLTQRIALALTPRVVCYSDLTAGALREQRPRLPIFRLAGQAEASGVWPGGEGPGDPALPPAAPVAVFLGRFVPHKRPHLAVDAVLQARAVLPDLRLVLIGRGPEEPSLRRRAAAIGGGVVSVLAGIDDAQVIELLRRASVVVHPSAREGFGLVVPEANGLGIPVVLVAGPHNAAPELIRRGGGVTVDHPEAGEIAAAVVATIGAGEAARREALANARRLERDHGVARSSRELLEISRALRSGPVPP